MATTTTTTTTTTSPTHFLNLEIRPEAALLQTIRTLQDKLHARLTLPPTTTTTTTTPTPNPNPNPNPHPLPVPVAPDNLHLTVCGLGLDDSGHENEVHQLLQDADTRKELRAILQDGGAAPAEEDLTVRLRGLRVFLPLDLPPSSPGPCAVVMSVDQARSAVVMRVIHHLRAALAGFLRERMRERGLPYNPHVTLVGNCYHDDPESLLEEEKEEERGVDFGACTVNKIYLSKLGDTTEDGIYNHRATLLLKD